MLPASEPGAVAGAGGKGTATTDAELPLAPPALVAVTK
jgi:hypothetical protein